MKNWLKGLAILVVTFGVLILMALAIARWPMIGFVLAAAGFLALVDSIKKEFDHGSSLMDVLKRNERH